ncbi:I78 family peptidase inhibitor [Sphingomonas sp. URHD0057]|uniref:I78 family peptidase inhibitor n=1 Tax=Sphingomonas sp. URHD0057 TaxID=1380389 RepID=UPI00048C4CBE|nr:I78 family peptidase inhibitor [Sphingomonas sp. URHD0057]
MHKLVLAPIALIACAATQNLKVGIDQVPPGSKCEPSAILNSFVGQPASVALAARLMTAARAPKLRWVAAGQAVTMDHSAHRLTVQLNAENRVVSMTCG